MTIIERLRLYKPIDNTSSFFNAAADLLESQAARIAELEAELAEEYLCRKEADVAINQYMALYRSLRRKIDEAPVVMEVGNGSLISKEDLQK